MKRVRFPLPLPGALAGCDVLGVEPAEADGKPKKDS
jgi:hypothetical protein